MTVKFKVRTPAHRIRNVSARPKSLSAKTVIKAFGGTPLAKVRGLDPIALLRMRDHLALRLRSLGGRPGLKDAIYQTKVPISKKQRADIQNLVSVLTADNSHPSFGQVVSILIDLGLTHIKESPQIGTVRKRMAEPAA